jgi:hypothetical protein
VSAVAELGQDAALGCLINPAAERPVGPVLREDGELLAGPSRRRVMVSTKYLLDHIEALLRLSHDAKDRAISVKIREMADELRILISVADVTDFAATLSSASSVAVPVSNEIVTALYGTKRKHRRTAKESASDTSSFKPKRRAKKRVDK